MTPEQFTALYEEHHARLLALARRFSPAGAEDLLQDALLKAYRFRDRFELGTNFAAWVGVIIKHTFINEYRREAQRPLELSITDNSIAMPHREPTGCWPFRVPVIFPTDCAVQPPLIFRHEQT